MCLQGVAARTWKRQPAPDDNRGEDDGAGPRTTEHNIQWTCELIYYGHSSIKGKLGWAKKLKQIVKIHVYLQLPCIEGDNTTA